MGKKLNTNVDRQSSFLNTEDYARYRLAAGKLDETGVTFTFVKVDTVEGEYGEFYRIGGTQEDGEDLIIDFSSSKLKKMLDKNFQTLYGRKIILSARGQKFDREYRIEILE